VDAGSNERRKPAAVDDGLAWGAWAFGPMPFALVFSAVVCKTHDSPLAGACCFLPLLPLTHLLCACMTIWVLTSGPRARRSPMAVLLTAYWLALVAAFVSAFVEIELRHEGPTIAITLFYVAFFAAVAMPLLGLARLALRR